MKKNFNVFLVFFLFSIFFTPLFISLAQISATGGAKPSDYIFYLVNGALFIIGAILFASLIYAGLIFILSKGDPAKVKEAKDRIFSAFLGAIILFFGYIILFTINPDLLVLKIPLIEKITREFKGFVLEPPKNENASLIVREILLGKSLDGEGGITEENYFNELKSKLLETKEGSKDKSFKQFLTQKEKVAEKDIDRISDLNKYLKSLTDECQCANANTYCARANDGGMPVGCGGDPCKKETRELINKILEKNKEKIETLKNYKNIILEERKKLVERMNNFGEVENEMLACISEKGGFFSLNRWLSLVNDYEELKRKATTLTGKTESKGDFLSFYCPVGGSDQELFSDLKTDLTDKTELNDNFDQEDEFASREEEVSLEYSGSGVKSCPFEIPVGETQDKLKDSVILITIKMERLSILIDEMIERIRDMINLVSQCNVSKCEAQCTCLPNPCYQLCGVIACGAIPCEPRCLQVSGQCFGDACPRKELDEKTRQIKETEDEIFLTLNEIDNTFSTINYLKSKENPYNLNNLRNSISLCDSSVKEDNSTVLLNCSQARGKYNSDGIEIGNCNPRNLFCCLSDNVEMKSLSGAKKSTIITHGFEKYQSLELDDQNCPKGWVCDDNVKKYKQYNDASEPLKKLLSCMRDNLDKRKQELNLKESLGRIVNITDSALYEGKCEWGTGKLEGGYCNFYHSVKDGKVLISSHYGGNYCYWEKKSYAVDIGVSSSFEKKYAQEIIKAVRDCDNFAYIDYFGYGPHYDTIHISVGAENKCGSY
jgi:hypothetical protein